MTTAQDISTILPEERRKQFEAHYAKQEPLIWAEGESCSRCGAYIYVYMRQTHELWHKNLSCQLWLLGGWPVEHMESHALETSAFQGVIASLMGFIDPQEGVPSSHQTYEGAPENPGPRCGGVDPNEVVAMLKGDDPIIDPIIAPVHEDGTTHAH